MQYSLTFPTGTVNYLFQAAEETLKSLCKPQDCIVVADSSVAALYPGLLAPYRTILLQPGEDQKNWQTIAHIAQELLKAEAHRKTALIGVGGGVVTDITGFIASVYMRGIAFGFVPTSLLGMVDAAIGGKNGISLGLHKNILGTINQPGFILFDTTLLGTLPNEEWSNGFAEIIKYACLFDADLFKELNERDVHFYQQHKPELDALVQKCAGLKNKIVLADEMESNERKLLNFGHTTGHALENLYHLPHGHAVALGMVVACIIAEKTIGLDIGVRNELTALLKKYNLPTTIQFDAEKVMALLKMDKKRNADTIDFIVLESIGHAAIMPLSFDIIYNALATFAHAGNH